MSHAAQAYARTSHTTAPPREIEAQALLKAARQLQDVQANWTGPDRNMHHALLFNRRLWSIFMSAAETNDNPQPLQIRQNIANIGVFVMKQTIEMQLNPDPALYQGTWTGTYANKKTFTITVADVNGFRAQVKYQSGSTVKYQSVLIKDNSFRVADTKFMLTKHGTAQIKSVVTDPATGSTFLDSAVAKQH